MAKTADDVLAEWVLRGYITDTDEPRYQSYIAQAKDAVLAYCNIPLRAPIPDGLFYPWVEIAWGMSNGTVTVEGSGEIKSISEGDTSITFDVGTSVTKTTTTVSYNAILNRYRRMP